MKTRIVLILITLLCATMASVQSARAAIITVSNTSNSGGGSLRQALADANDGDTIDFSVTGTITLTSGELLVDKSVTISGPSADQLSVDGNFASIVFHISPGKNVTISGLSIINGYAGGVGGGGIYNDHATLTLSSCTLSGNWADSAGGGIHSDGAYGSATLTINNSTLSGNSCGFTGGGIDNVGSFGGSATMTLNNSTFSGNSSGGPGGGLTNDGGAGGNAAMTINNSTLSGNSSGCIYNYASPGACNGNGSATLTIRHTILNNGAWGGNIFNAGTVTSLGYNLSDDDSGGVLTGPGDQINTDPLLGPLQDNGGPTFTHELLSGSPAIDAGDPVFTPPPDYDQRGPGFPRVGNCRIDIGSFEAQATGNAYTAQVQPPINADGTSIFNVRRGVIPVKFTLTRCGGVATCDLPPATIAVTRTAGGVIGQINESVYNGPSDSGSNFRIEGCQYHYNLNSNALGVGTYRVDILINGQVVGGATFKLK